MVRVKIEGDNEPKPSVPREEGSVPFIFVGKTFKILGKGDNVVPNSSSSQPHQFNRWSDYIGYRIEIVCLIGTLSTLHTHNEIQ